MIFFVVFQFSNNTQFELAVSGGHGTRIEENLFENAF